MHHALLAPRVRWLALAVMVGTALLPLGGDRLGGDFCPLHRATGLPCPGCGLTRGLAAVTHGDFSTAAGLNPFAFVAWPLLAALAVLALAPSGAVARLQRRLDAYGPALTRAFHVGLAALVGFGALRFATHLVLGTAFP
jgi:hypothetical protein